MSEPWWRRLFRGQTPYEVIELGGKQPPNPPPMPVGAATADPPSPPMSEHARLREENERLREAILDIDAHATPLGSDDDGFVKGGYIVSVGAIHRALGVVGHTSPSCRLCDPSQHDCATAVGAVLAAAMKYVDADDLLSRAKAESALRESVGRLR